MERYSRTFAGNRTSSGPVVGYRYTVGAVALVCVASFGLAGCFTDGEISCETADDCFRTQECIDGVCQGAVEDTSNSGETVRDTGRPNDTIEGDSTADTSSDSCMSEEDGEEMCNGLDDDCDGETDEPKTCSSTGVCDGPTVKCSGGSYESCESVYDSPYEAEESTVDGLDNDCDGVTDEVFKRVEMENGNSVCGLTLDDNIHCWGGQAGGMEVSIEGDFQDLAVGGQFVCGLRGSDSVDCWKTRSGAELPDPDDTYSFRDIAATQKELCAANGDGNVRCWDGNRAAFFESPSPIANLDVSAEARCGTDAKSITCWGRGTDDLDDSAPAQGPYRDVALEFRNGVEYGCALGRNTPSISCWGDPNADSSPQGKNWRSVDVAAQTDSDGSDRAYGCAVESDENGGKGNVACWGFTRGVEVPQKTFRQIALYRDSGCGVLEDHSVTCWGTFEGRVP